MDMNGLQKALKFIYSENPLLMAMGIFFIAVIVLLNVAKLIESFNPLLERRMKYCREYLNDSAEETQNKRFIRAILESELFRKSSNIHSDRKLRDQVVNLYLSEENTLDVKHFQRASSFFRLIEGQLKIQFNIMDKISSWTYLFAGWFYFFWGSFFLMSLNFYKGDSRHLLIIILKAIFLFAIAIYFFKVMNWPYLSTKKILTQHPHLKISGKTDNIKPSAKNSSPSSGGLPGKPIGD